jgi:hypothetical protein
MCGCVEPFLSQHNWCCLRMPPPVAPFAMCGCKSHGRITAQIKFRDRCRRCQLAKVCSCKGIGIHVLSIDEPETSSTNHVGLGTWTWFPIPDWPTRGQQLPENPHGDNWLPAPNFDLANVPTHAP